MPISPFCNILQSVAALSTSPNCPRASYILQRLSRPHATPSPLQVATLSTSPVWPPALHVLQHAHACPISCNTLQSALPPHAHILQHLTVRPSPACACLATPHSPPFPACACLATPRSPHFPHLPVCALCIATRIFRPHASPHSPHLPRLPACAYVLPISQTRPLTKWGTCCSILEYQ